MSVFTCPYLYILHSILYLSYLFKQMLLPSFLFQTDNRPAHQMLLRYNLQHAHSDLLITPYAPKLGLQTLKKKKKAKSQDFWSVIIYDSWSSLIHSWLQTQYHKDLGCFHISSSVHLVRTKGKQLYIVAFFSFFGSFSHHTDCFGPNQLKRTKMQSHDNIHITHWPWRIS